jgi:radical SAM superfamily enzyme YgiQ (UPF0313 family)
MPDIVLATLNAKYPHASFGLRYLMANLGDLRHRAQLFEFDISQRPLDIAEALLAGDPKIVGLGVYIWNTDQTTQVVSTLKRLRPDLTVVVGGPEVSYEIDDQPICRLADYVVTGEADVAFAHLCRQLLANRRPLMKVIPAALPEFEVKGQVIRGKGQAESSSSLAPCPSPLAPPSLTLPYDLYTDEDIARRVIYVEASRGCPFRCEFCLSSLDVPVRAVPLNAFLAEMGKLLGRGVRQFKFVDRTFNLNAKTGQAILQFFHDRYVPGLFLHFEMIPDRLPESLRTWIAKFPPGALQFEVGIQTFNDHVSDLISRKQDNAKVEENFRFLRQHTGVHLHADLIVGLPGEDLDSFAAGFDRLVSLDPQEIQVGILKRLRGTPITRHDAEWGMVYSPHAPYEILRTRLLDFPAMQRLRRFARYWDLIANSGNFRETSPLVWRDGSPFRSFLALGDWIYAETGQTHAIALARLAELIFRHLTEVRGHSASDVAETLWRDYQRVGRSDRPDFLRPHISDDRVPAKSSVARPGRTRQSKHLA